MWRTGWCLAAGARLVGSARQLHAARRTVGAPGITPSRRTVHRHAGLRPDLWRVRIAVAARGARGRLPDPRRPADAHRTGGTAVRMVDGAPASAGGDAGGGAQ